jgi:hypothetical protein
MHSPLLAVDLTSCLSSSLQRAIGVVLDISL